MTPRKETPIATRQAVINMRENGMRGTEIAMGLMAESIQRSHSHPVRHHSYRTNNSSQYRSESDLAFEVLCDGCKVFSEFESRKRSRYMEKVIWCVYEWSLWFFLPLSITTIIQYYAKSATIGYVLAFAPIVTFLTAMEVKAIRHRNFSHVLIYKYAQLKLYTFFFIYHIICFAIVHSHADFVFFVVFTIHFVFYMFSLIRVYLIGEIYKIMLYRHQMTRSDRFY